MDFLNIGELFIKLGVQGTDKTVGSLGQVKKGLGEAKSMSLGAYAAIIAAVYAFKSMTSSSNQAGTELTNFGSILDTSTKTLQQYEYAGRQIGITNNEVESSFKSLGSAMAKTLLGEGAPKGLARVAQLTGNISTEDIKKFSNNPELLIQRLQTYTGKESNKALRNETLRSFGLSDSMIAGLAKNQFRPEILNKAPTYSNNQANALAKNNAAWSNLETKIEMSFGKLNASKGGQMVAGISKIADAVIRLADALLKFDKSFHVLDKFAKFMDTFANVFSKPAEYMEGKRDFWGQKLDDKGKVIKGEETFTGKIAGFVKSLREQDNMTGTPDVSKNIVPNTSKPSISNSSQNINVKQDLHFNHDGKDHKKTSGSVKKAVQDSYRQISAQGQAS